MKKRQTETLPKVSFIIPTLNAQHILAKCLSAIRGQHYPKEKVEIFIADGGSTDKTKAIAKKYGAKIIKNPEILHEPGKSLASRKASGAICFYTDADNILAHSQWIIQMVTPYLKEKNVVGLLPQTIAAPDSNPVDRYLGHLFTDPFTWFVYYPSASPAFFWRTYKPLKTTPTYVLYSFTANNPPLFGLSQGVGTARTFTRTDIAHADDMLAGIKLISEGGIVAYVPAAGVYHYHISGVKNFIRKYTWRLRNNFSQEVKGMGIVHRTKYFPLLRRIRMVLFVPYALSIVFPALDAVRLYLTYRDPVMFLHIPMTFLLAVIIVAETVRHITGGNKSVGTYG